MNGRFVVRSLLVGLLAGMLAINAAPAEAAGPKTCWVKNTTLNTSYNGTTGAVLQAAIDAAGSANTLEVRGRCVGNFRLTTKTLTLVGKPKDGYPVATLDGNGAGHVVLLDFCPPGNPTCTTDITLTDLLITNGRLGGDTLNDAGGGIYNNHAILTLSGSTEVSGNRAAYGGGIASYGSVTLKDSARVVDNTATVAGGGIYMSGAPLNACTTWTGAISPNSPNDSPATTPIACPASPGAPSEAWSATISGAGISGDASLRVPATGWATAAFSLNHLKTGVSISARIVAGAACDASARTITELPGYTTTIGGTWRQRWVFDGAGLVRLRFAIRLNTQLWIDVSAGGRSTCARYVNG